MIDISSRAETLQNCSISLREPLNLLHHRIVTLFDDIPPTSKIKEIALRILFLVTLPLSYLVSSFLSLTANLLESFSFNSLPLDDQKESDNNVQKATHTLLNTRRHTTLQYDFQGDESKPSESPSRLSRRPQSSPYFEDLEAMIESRPITDVLHPTKFLFRTSGGYALENYDHNTIQINEAYQGFTKPAPKVKQVSPTILTEGTNDVDDEVYAIFSKKGVDGQTFSDTLTNGSHLARSSSIEELALYVETDSDNELEAIYASKASPVPVIAYHSKSDFKVPTFPSKDRLLSSGQVNFIESVEGVTHVDKSDNLFTKFHALAAIQFLSKHFTKSLRAWDKREDNIKGVSDFFSEIQKKSIEVASGITPKVALTLLEDFDREESIPDLFKDFKFDAPENHQLVEINGDSNKQFSEFTTHLFTPLEDRGKPFALVVFDDNSTISYLAVDLNTAFLFDSTKPHFRLVDVLGSCGSIIEKISGTKEPKKVNFYFGALKTDI